MIWISEADNNRINVWNVRRDAQTGRVTCNGSIREKGQDGKNVYQSINVRFSNAVADRAATLQDKQTIVVTKGGVGLYQSKKYLTDKGAGIFLPYLQVNDFEVFEWNNNQQAQPTAAAPRTNTRANSKAPTKAPMPAAEDDLPWGNADANDQDFPI